MSARRLRPLLVLVLVVLAIGVGRWVHAQLGFGWDQEALRAWVDGLGWLGPVCYVGLVAHRQFLLIPSIVIMPLGGLAFGAVLGTVLAGVGVTVSGVMQFAIARGLGGEWVRNRLGRGRLGRVQQRVERAGALFVGAVTGHPAGPMTPVHWAAGLSQMHLMPFITALAAGAFVRAGALAVFGASLADLGSARFVIVSLILGIAVAAPLLHGRTRRWLLLRAEGEGALG